MCYILSQCVAACCSTVTSITSDCCARMKRCEISKMRESNLLLSAFGGRNPGGARRSKLTSVSTPVWSDGMEVTELQHAATRCNTLQHAATRCNTLHCSNLCIDPVWSDVIEMPVVQPAATCCNLLQHIATQQSTYRTLCGQM